MPNSIVKELPELIRANIITEEVANRIRDYYQTINDKPNQRLTLIFGSLGSLLIGLGIILVISHNWDKLNQSIKVVLAYLPLVIGQGFCFWVFIKPKISDTWRESIAGFTFLAIGACIALISQTFHVSGELVTFLLSWALLGLPLVYVLQSSFVSLLYLLVITYFVSINTFLPAESSNGYWSWLLLALNVPFYYTLCKNKPTSNFTHYHHLFIPLFVILSVGKLGHLHEEFLYLAFISLFSLFYIIGTSPYFLLQNKKTNGYYLIGIIGTLLTLFIFSSEIFIRHLQYKRFALSQLITAPEFLAAGTITLVVLALWVYRYRHQSVLKSDLFEIVFFLFIPVFLLGFFSTILSTVGANIIILGLGIYQVVKGIKLDYLSILNSGLLIISALIICRFFDSDISFILRGILFILVGPLFFFCNFWILQKRKKYAQ